MLKSPSQLPIEIKISTVVAISTILYSADPLAIDAALKQMTGGTSDFFEDEFAVIDVTTLADSAPVVEWDKLVAVLKKYRLNAVAVRGASPAMGEAIRAHGLSLDDGVSGIKPRQPLHAAPAPSMPAAMGAPPSVAAPSLALAPVSPAAPVAPTVPLPAAATAVVTPGTMVIDTPVRAGQRVYARGCDLIITATVNNGAEVIADGSIHVYAALNGRALAGASGNAEARIFALAMQPELVSIAGVYRTFDEGFPPQLARQPAQIRLVGDRIDILSLSPAPAPTSRT